MRPVIVRESIVDKPERDSCRVRDLIAGGRRAPAISEIVLANVGRASSHGGEMRAISCEISGILLTGETRRSKIPRTRVKTLECRAGIRNIPGQIVTFGRKIPKLR